MAANTYTRITISGAEQHTRNGTQGRPKQYADPYVQRLFEEDEAWIKANGYSRNDFVRLATHAMIEKMDNSVYTELVNT